MQQALAKVENLEVQPGSVADLIWIKDQEGWKVGGVKLSQYPYIGLVADLRTFSAQAGSLTLPTLLCPWA